MNKQELVALLNSNFNGKKFPNYPAYDIARLLNAALNLSEENYFEKALSGEHSRDSNSTILLIFKKLPVAKIVIHKKKGDIHHCGYCESYYDWTIKEFKDEDITIFNGNTLEEAMEYSLKKTVEAKQLKDGELKNARKVMDHLAAEYNLDDDGVIKMCDFIKSNLHTLESMKVDNNPKIV